MQDTWLSGSGTATGVLQLLAAVRKHSNNPAVIAGAAGYAYDAASLIGLDANLTAMGESNVVYNFHPYVRSLAPLYCAMGVGR